MKRKKGFTLIELLVVISIVAILSTVGIVVFRGITANARDSVRIRDLQTIKQDLELYRGDFHNYLPTLGLDLSTGTTSAYLQQIPQDVDTSERNYYYLASPANCDNSSSIRSCSGFILCAKKEGTSTSYDLPACSSLGNCGSAGNCDIGISSE